MEENPIEISVTLGVPTRTRTHRYVPEMEPKKLVGGTGFDQNQIGDG